MSGKSWKWIHFVLVIFFVGLWITAAVMGWINSVAFVAHVSMVALVLGSLSAWQAARTEQKQDDEIEKNEQRDNAQDDYLGLTQPE